MSGNREARFLAAAVLVVSLTAFAFSVRFQVHHQPSLVGAAKQLSCYFTAWTDLICAGTAWATMVGRGRLSGREWQTRAALAAVLTMLCYWEFQGWPHFRTNGLGNMLGHGVLPVLMIALWIVARNAAPLRREAVAGLPGYALTYIGLVLARGSISGSYPYPPLDVGRHGYRVVLALAVAITVAHWLIGFALVGLDRRLRSSKLGPQCAREQALA